ncbi:ABC transporter permease [Neolewinella lacunae]|uniref:ABC transporter permease n=1 Tax=Neolewinella lacunae TaxID=1517758 RepID=A0A923TE09_9BACT|nr:ABC transporter permease [Neolewinella lacunae]MBC6995412.1 ABC transporter permease [Neolewinella lacunae]MDN3633845.1 ABC transporter permease [Neolewinella lacunae]
MKNLWLVIQREYITRVRRKSFLLATLLTPLGIAVFIVVVQFIFSYENDEVNRIAVVDQGKVFSGPIPDEQGLYFKFVDKDIETLKGEIRDSEDPEYGSILVIPEVKNTRAKDFRIQYFSDEPLTLDLEMAIKGRVEKALRNYKITALELDESLLKSLDSDVDIRSQKITVEEGEKADTSMAGVVGAALGTIMGFMMYLSIFIYGMMVMRSVMEEKMNRIVEVVISSVRPTTLLLGKIIGVGAVGLTQVLAWMVLIPAVIFLATLVFGFDADAAQQMPQSPEMDPEEMQSMVERVMAGVAEMNWWVILPCFIIYFLGGYFMYAALFAAVGSAMGDDLGEGQSLTLPITIPVILALYIMMAAMQAPNSSLAVTSSFIPLFAPIVMPARLPFGPPAWQIILSLLVVIGFAAAMVWLAARIYRVGILNYGKKSSFKDMSRWLFSKY